MVDVVDALKARARILHRKAKAGSPQVAGRLRAMDDLRLLDDEAFAAHVRRRHCLTLVARDFGFDGWGHAVQVLRGNNADDFGKLLCPPRCGGHFNIWSASYEEARTIRAQHGGYLLPYQRQFLVVDDGYLRTLGLDPEDPDWRRMGRDWVRPQDAAARQRLYGKLIEAAPGH